MLILASKLLNTPIMGLQTGSQLALTGDAIINPANLQILAYKLKASSFSDEEMLIRIADIRELSRIGFIVDSAEDFILPTDVIKIKEILELNFNILNLKVEDKKGSKVGKIIDYTLSLADFPVQQLIVKRPILKSLNDPTLTIHRSQIVEIDDNKIVIKSEEESLPQKSAERAENFVPNYVNPFRDWGSSLESALLISSYENPCRAKYATSFFSSVYFLAFFAIIF